MPRVDNCFVRNTLRQIGDREVLARSEMQRLRTDLGTDARRVLITGGAGNVGSNLALALTWAGYHVAVLDNLVNGHQETCDITGAKLFPFDLRDYQQTLNCLKEFRPDAVIHAASLIEVGESERERSRYIQNNIGGGIHLLTAMQEIDCMRLIFSNTAAIYATSSRPIGERARIAPQSIYAITKSFFNDVLMSGDYPVHTTSLNYFNVFGSTDERFLREDHGIGKESHLIPILLQVAMYNLIERMGLKLPGYDENSIAQSYLEGNRKFFTVYGRDYATPDRTCVRDYVDMDTMLFFHTKALDRILNVRSKSDYLRCNIGTMTGRSVLDIINTTENVLRRELGLVAMSDDVFDDLDSKERLIPVKMGERRPGDADRLVANPTKARRLFGERKTGENDFERALLNSFWAMAYRPGGYSGRPAVDECHKVLAFYPGR